jgi:hypothetical protein
MSASVRESDPGPSKDEPLKYAPKKARLPNPDQKPGAPPLPPHANPDQKLGAPPLPPHATPDQKLGASPLTPSDSPAPRPPEPPWRRSRQRGTFAGDVAIAELRTKLALAPDRLPEPPLPSLGNTKLVWAGRIAGVAVVALVGFAGYRWGSSPSARVQLFHHAPRQPPEPSMTAANLDQSPDPDQSATGNATLVNAVPAVYPPPKPPNGQPARRLVVGNIGLLQTDEVARLTISAGDSGANTAVVIGGLAPGSTLSAGREVAPNTWRVSSGELAGAFITPPRGFTGIMDLTLELRLADNSMADRKGLQLEWGSRGSGAPVIAKIQSRQHDPSEIAQMVKRGVELMTNGDVAAARLMYQRAAEAGEAGAAFALAETYDPLVLKGGVPPDAGLARAWYERAKDLGSAMAPDRLERLMRMAE